MSDFNASSGASATLDIFKRVYYETGLVLGADEFWQEQLYLLEQDRRHNRVLHSYGTICGLDVSVADSSRGVVVTVSAGVASDPKGRWICIPRDQCAYLDDWLTRNRAEAEAGLGSPPLLSPPQLELYVVLCYRECNTDEVPIPGGPCRSLEDSKTPSRIADTFQLELRAQAPRQVEENRVRAFGEFLQRIEISDAPGPFLDRATLEELVHTLARSGDVAAVTASATTSPPGGGLRLHRAEAAELLRAALRVWAAERNCSCEPPAEDCIQLARLDVPITESGGRLQVAGAVSVDQDDRPYLLHTRLLQELVLDSLASAGVSSHSDLSDLLADDHAQYLLVNDQTRALLADLDADGNRVVALAPGSAPGDAVEFQQAIKVNDPANGDLGGTYPDPSVVALQGRPVAPTSPQANDVLTWDGAGWGPQPVAAGGTVHANLTGLNADDHPQYLLADGSRSLSGNWNAGAGGTFRITGLAAGINPGDAVEFQQAIKVNDPANGDLGGTYPDPSVVALQGRPVSAAAPQPGNVLTWDAGQTQWEPALTPLEQGLTRITALSWVHGQPRANPFQFILDNQPALGLVVGFSAAVFVTPGSLDEQTFQLFVESGTTGLVTSFRVVPREIRPVRPDNVQNNVITQAFTSPSPAVGAALLIDPAILDRVLSLRSTLLVVIRGDFVQDTDRRALDAEHLRGSLPTGDRPAGARWGIQGGRFESWIPIGNGDRININTATLDELATLPGIGLNLARRIIDFRTAVGPFASVDDLAQVGGISAAMIAVFRNLITVG